jgi:phosphatidate phosphatase APP1
MASLYTEWAMHDVGFHFVSSSPWQLYAPLHEFLDASGFPPSEMNLKAVRFRDETLFDLFKKGTETKPPVIEKILATYPDRQFFLVGDSGEQDPEVYSAMLRKHPEQILKVFIRNVTEETRDNHRFANLFEGINDDCWQLFDHAPELTTE